MWSKYITRRLAVQVAQSWNYGWGEEMEKIYGLSVKNIMVFRDNNKTEYYVDDVQHLQYISGLYKLLENKQFIETFHKDAKKKIEGILREVKIKLSLDLAELSDKKLLEIYKDFILPNVAQFYVRMWTVFNIGEPLANVITERLEENITDKEKSTEYLLNFSSPLVPNDVMNERIDLLKLAITRGRMAKKEFLFAIKKHSLKYRHIPMFDFDHEPYSEDFFTKEIKMIENPRKELGEIKNLFKNRATEFRRVLKNTQPDSKFRKLLYFLKENIFLRDYRDMIRQKLNLELRRFYQEIGKRVGLNISQVATLTDEEIISCLSRKKGFPLQEVKRREKAYLLIQKGSQAHIWSGGRALIRFKSESNRQKILKVKELRGIIGATGKAAGRVRIIFTNRDLHKVKKGDVLVAPMTRQDFITAIRRASALVTDEGSVTCHAAIIARELKKPCIVAVKIATQVLRDGDIVEVDANKGVVTVVNKK